MESWLSWPYMERSGIQEENYFPLAFSSWRQGEVVYGANVSMTTYNYIMDASVLGGLDSEPDIEALVNALYDYEEKAMYMRFCEGSDILEMFLEGSEDFWGMLDWEAGRCDFSGELFQKMMEVAKRYAYDENQECPILASDEPCHSLILFPSPSVKKQLGRVEVGVMFEDGCHAKVISAYQILAINANSTKKEGAWEFISYLLGEEGQRLIAVDATPVNREIFQEELVSYLEGWSREDGPRGVGSSYLFKGKYVKEMRDVYKSDITEEWIEAYIRCAEEARPLPVRTKPVLNVIREEAEDYFSGMKSLDEVIGIMENRVQLYLNEHKIG